MYHIYLGELKSTTTFTKKEAQKRIRYYKKTYGEIVRMAKAK